MTPEQSFKFRCLLSNLINATTSGEVSSRQLAHEDHLRNYMSGLLEEKDAEIERLNARVADLEGFDPLPVLNRDEDSIVRSMFSREQWRRSAMSDWAQAAVITLEEKGLLCEDDYNPDEIYITNAGKAYVEGRRLPRLVIPPYNE